MKLAATLAAAAVALSACTTLEGALDKGVPATCRIGSNIYAAFVVTESTGNIPAKTIAKVEASYAALSALCADPSKVKAEDLPVIIATAYANFIRASKEAQK